jgi:hypothetical protein
MKNDGGPATIGNEIKGICLFVLILAFVGWAAYNVGYNAGYLEGFDDVVSVMEGVIAEDQEGRDD